MYGALNSVIHNFPVTKPFGSITTANGPVSLSVLDPNRGRAIQIDSNFQPRTDVIYPTPNSIQYSHAFTIGQRVAQNIYWTGNFVGGKIIRTFRSRTDIISTTKEDYYQ